MEYTNRNRIEFCPVVNCPVNRSSLCRHEVLAIIFFGITLLVLFYVVLTFVLVWLVRLRGALPVALMGRKKGRNIRQIGSQGTAKDIRDASTYMVDGSPVTSPVSCF